MPDSTTTNMVGIQRVLNSQSLPTLPTVAVQLLDLTNDPDVSIASVMRVIRMDPAISAKIVKAANSSYFGLNSQVTSIESAVPLLGSTVVTSLALSFSLLSETAQSQSYDAYFRAFWSQSLLQGVTAETVSKRYKTGHPAQCFLAGLLCDIGVLAQLNSIPDEYSRVLDQATETQTDLVVVEREVLGFDHVEIGVKMMEAWRMPTLLQEAVRHHHAPPEELANYSDPSLAEAVRTIRFATSLGELLSGRSSTNAHDRLLYLGKAMMSLDEEQLNGMLDELRDLTDEAAKLMSIDTTQLARPSEILAQANSRLVEIALREHAAKSQVSVKSAALERENRKLRQRNSELHDRADMDALTGLYNRGSFDQLLQENVCEALVEGTSIGLIFADLDEFKSLNDTYGHKFGDEVLRRVARIIRSQVRDTDVVARYGGEEFVIITARCPLHIVQAIVERIRRGVECEQFLRNGDPIQVTVSVGACVADTSQVHFTRDTFGDYLLQRADAAMYYCKRTGKNQTCVVTPSDSLPEGDGHFTEAPDESASEPESTTSASD
jgi:diguanylate cyclase (GGDEF)-like protein